ncbi:High-affinity glucose transporter HXT2 [Vanrija pseudolonga]|uniref:High-affinity glucose transporter HXT2 n=1 Tax=Vanrija pseudolonga TaxID=143232 RepID=A0AAF1BPH6_9TREE|nr:High-affinity glucose transporter HXT2 [Vanrija pseudolonga]
MSQRPEVSAYDEKAEVTHVEATADGVIIQKATEFSDTQLKSELDSFSLLKSVKVFRRIILVCFAAGLCAALDGYQHQMIASIVANKGFIKQFSNGGTKLDPKHVSTFGGVYSAGMVLGQFVVQWPLEWLGRRGGVWVCCVVLALAAMTECLSKVWWNWTIARLIAGMGVGAIQVNLPVYINEMAAVQIRGIVVVAYSFWFAFGQFFASIALYSRNKTHPYDWRIMIYTQFAMIGLMAGIFIILPESPWWLVRKNKLERAKKVLQWNYKGVPGFDADHEISIIAATIEQQKRWELEAKSQGPFAILTGLNLKRFLIGCYPKVLQQFAGLALFTSYATYFFQLAGNKDPFNVTLILTCVGWASVLLDAALVDVIGRRRMTLIGFSGACTGVLIMAIIGCFQYENAKLGAVLVFGGVFANFCNQLQGSTSYAYLTEMPELRFKARATGWGLAFCNIWAILINFCLPLMIQKWAVKAAWFFVCLGIPGTVLAYFIMPESMGRSSAEIHELFVERVNLRKWKGHKTNIERDLDARMNHAQGI